MKKKITFLILLLVFSSFFLLHKKTVSGAAEIIDPNDKYGFRLTVLKYTGQGDPVQIKMPILVYEKGLLNDWEEKINGYYPTGENAYDLLMKNKYELTQIMPENVRDGVKIEQSRKDSNVQYDSTLSDEEKAEAQNPNNSTDAVSTEAKENMKGLIEQKSVSGYLYDMYSNNKFMNQNDALIDFAKVIAEAGSENVQNTFSRNEENIEYLIENIDLYNNAKSDEDRQDACELIAENLKENNYLIKGLDQESIRKLEELNGKEYVNFEHEYLPQNCPNETPEDKLFGGIANTNKKIIRYMSDERKVRFLSSMIDLSEYHNVYEEEEMGSAYEMAKKYGGNPEKLKRYFDIDASPMDMEFIYIKVEVMQRLFDKDSEHQIVLGTYTAGFAERMETYPTQWTADKSDWYVSSTVCPPEYPYKDDNGFSAVDIDGDNGAISYNCYKLTTATRTKKTTVRDISKRIDASSGDTCEGVYGEGYYEGLGVPGGVTMCVIDVEETEEYPVKKYGESIRYYKVKNCHNGEDRIYYFIGVISAAPSKLVAAKDNLPLLKNDFTDRAMISCTNPGADHCIKDITGKCIKSADYLYYIGPNIEKALVGPATVKDNAISHIHKMNDAKWNETKYTCSPENGSPELGVQYIYFFDFIPECEIECKKIFDEDEVKDYGSDKYLLCAELFAEHKVDNDLQSDKKNARKKKLDIILNNCGYTYGKSPSDGTKTNEDRQSVNSCDNSSSKYVKGVAFKYIEQRYNAAINSKCNVVDEARNVTDVKGVRVENCSGDKITDFDGKDEGDTKFDHRTYVNKVCKDTTSFEFVDTSKIPLVKGGGFEYPVIQKGERICTYFFNLEQWKVDYASAPARDPDARKRLEYILERFNAAATNKSVGPSGLSDEGDIDMYGVHFEEDYFNYDETVITSKVNEFITTKSTADNKNLTLEVVDVRDSGPMLTVEGSDTVLKAYDGNIEILSVNKYVSKDEVEVTYGLKKVCLSTDGQAEVIDSPSSGICYQQKVKQKNGNGFDMVDVLAQRKHYTSFQIDNKKDSEINTVVTVGKDNNIYYSDDETCTYKPSSPYTCSLIVDGDDVVKKGNGEYYTESNRVSVKLKYQINSSLISSKSIFDNSKEYANLEEILIGNSVNNSVEKHKLYGKIKLKDGSEVICPETIEIYKPSSCEVSCKIEKENDKKYKIVSTGRDVATNFYAYAFNIDFDNKIAVPVGENKNHYVRLDKALGNGDILHGYVTTSNPNCNAPCEYPIYEGNDGSVGDCYKEYTPDQRNEIKQYCDKDWQTDVNGFKDSTDCYDKCVKSTGCPNDCTNITAIEEYCERTFPNNKEVCMNTCFCPIGEGDDYVFRNINVLNPFPNSSESVAPYESGNRTIGKNWQFLSRFITDDSEDETTVTGDFANKGVEYVIDMSPSDIRSIRKDTKENDINTTYSRRKVYAKLDRIKTSSKTVEAYKSQFINQKYASLFKNSHGNIPASFSPNS